MINILSIRLQAILEGHNIFREYGLHVGKDLFGEWILTTTNSRIGNLGKLRYYSFKSLEELQKKLHQLLNRRQRAKNRIGVDYKIISCSYAHHLIEENLLNDVLKLAV